MDLLNHLNKMTMATGKKKKLDTEYTTQQKQKYRYQKDYLAYKPASEPN